MFIPVVCALTLWARVPTARQPAVETPPVASQPTAIRDVSSVIAPIIEKHHVPGAAAAVVTSSGVVAHGVAGVRQLGSDAQITLDDRFHLGSCTKSMTATMIATLVDEKTISWDTTLQQALPDVAMDDGWKGVTLEQLLTNSSGAPGDLNRDGLWGALWSFKGTPTGARRALVEGVVKHPPMSAPGSKFIYSNAGFSMAGHVAETVTHTAWEDLMRTRIFEPLGMKSAGFGAPGTKEVVDQPRGHHPNGTPVQPGPGSDNPVAIGPAGIVHCTIDDWGKYAAFHLRDSASAKVNPAVVSKASLEKLHAPHSFKEGNNRYAMGWGLADRAWGKGSPDSKGTVLTHNGSNTMWFCVVWLAPETDFGVVVASNQGGDEAAKACDEIAAALIREAQKLTGSDPTPAKK